MAALTTASILWGLAEFVPDVVKWITGDDKDESIANKVLDVAKTVTGKESEIDALDSIKSNPSIALEYQKAVMADSHIKDKIELEKYKEDTKRLESINKTMQIETNSKNWWSSAWRPFIGFITGISFFVAVVWIGIITHQAIIEKDFNAINMIPSLIFNITTLFGVPCTILGIAAHHRGVEKRTKAADFIKMPKELLQKIKGE